MRVRRRLPVADKTLRDVAQEKAHALYREMWGATRRKETETGDLTFAEAARLYVEQGGEERFLPRIVRYFGTGILAADVDHVDIARAAKKLYSRAKPETVTRQLRVPVKAVQNFAAGRRREEYKDTRHVRWLTPEEAERLLEAAASPERVGLRDHNRETLGKIAFMLGTGAGRRETMSLTVDGWNPEAREWGLPGTKSVYRARYVRLPIRTVDLIG